MSAVTVTYQELPPMASWAADGQNHNMPMADGTAAAMMQFGDGARAQCRDEAGSQSGWFGLEGLEVKCDPGHGAAGWTMGGTLLDSSAGDGHPPPYAAAHHASPYCADIGTAAVSSAYSYDCCPSGGKKRFTYARPGSGSTGHGLVGVAPAVGTGPVMAPEELCLVCGDKASGYHYNALTCEGCKGFFRRSITRKAMYYCKYGGHCDIDMYMRRKCQACRLRKCLDIGMRPELVIPEEQCRLKRESKNKMRTLNGGNSTSSAPVQNADERKSNSPQQVTSTDALSPNPPVVGLTPEQRELVHRIVRYQDQYEMPSDEDLAKLSRVDLGVDHVDFVASWFPQYSLRFTLGQWNSSGLTRQFQAFRNEQHQTQQGHTHFQHLAELTILNVQLIVEFTKHLPGFMTLNKEDQLTLLKACSTEILMLKTARRYDQKTDTVVLGNRTTSWAYSRDAYKQAGMGSATDAIFEFAKSMAKLRVDAAEFALLTTISIFSERPGLVEPRKVEDIQEVYTSTLQAYIDAHRPKNRTVFARLLMKLTDLRTLGCEQADVLFSLKMSNGQCRLPVALPHSTEQEEGEPAAKAVKTDPAGNGLRQPHDHQQCQSEGSLAGPSTANHRVPNVRIKVEPLVGRVSAASNGQLFNAQYGGDGLSGALECHSTLYSPVQDDANNNHHYQRQHQTASDEDSIHQQRAISSSSGSLLDASPKWN